MTRRVRGHTSRGRKRISVLLVSVLIAAGCGDDDSAADTVTPTATQVASTDSTTSTTPGEPEEAATDTTQAATEGEVDLDATFVFGYNRAVTRLDPHRASSGWDGTTLFPVYDRLVHVSPEGELIPGLAESWEFNEDATELTMHLREGVRFHDGTPFDAEAAKANLDRARSLEGTSVATDLSTIDSVTVVDPQTIVLSLKQPDVSLLGPLSDRAGMQVSPKALADGVDLDEQMIGAGPYRFVSHTPGVATVYERNDDYWDTEHVPAVARLELRIIPDDTTRLNALKTGELTAALIAQNQIAELDADEQFEIALNTELQFVQLIQNRSRARQDDLRIRQALVSALDREAICEAVYLGYCEVSDQPFPPGYFAFNPDIDQVLYPHDPDRARQLLEEADATDLQLDMIVGAGLTQFVQLAEIIQAQWADVGVDLTVRQVDPAQSADIMFTQQAADSSLSGASGRPDPSQYLYGRMRGDSFGNPGGHTTPRMEELITASITETDPAARQDILRAASREVAESLLEINVVIPQIPYAMRSNASFTPYLTAKPEFRDVAVMAE